MRVLYVCNEYPPVPHGGIGSVVRTLARGVVDAGHEAVVVGFDPSRGRSAWTCDGLVDVYRLAPNYLDGPRFRLGGKSWNLASFNARRQLSAELNRLLKVVEPDIIESHDWSGPLWTHPGVPLLVRLHGCSLAHADGGSANAGHLTYRMERRNLAMADALVAVSHHIGMRTISAAGMRRSIFPTIYNGIDTEHFRRIPSVSTTEPVVLFPGAVTERKGIRQALAALPLIHQHSPNARFSFVGRLPAGGAGGPLLAPLLARLPWKVRERVSFEGARDHDRMREEYSRADVSVFASLSEAFGMACVEAMACESAVVMTALDSGPEVVTNGETGLLADPREPQSIAAAVSELLESPRRRSELGAAARRRVGRIFDAHKQISTNLDFYQAVVEGSHSQWRYAA